MAAFLIAEFTSEAYWIMAAAGVAIMAYRWRNGRKRARQSPNVLASVGVRRAVGAYGPASMPQHAAVNPYGREDLIESLCRRTGCLLLRREGSEYWVRPPCATRGQEIRVGVGGGSVLFQEHLGVEFPLDREPPGLFARLMLRSFSLHYARWCMAIGGRLDAHVSVSARIPAAALDPALFDAVCREIISEVEAFHQELQDKFRYSIPSGACPRAGLWPDPGACPGGTDGPGQQGRTGVPMRRGWDDGVPEIRHFSE